MKNKLTRKLMLSAFTLLFAVISLGASTYAWFTMSKDATIQAFQGTVTSGTSGLEVAITAYDNFTVQESDWSSTEIKSTTIKNKNVMADTSYKFQKILLSGFSGDELLSDLNKLVRNLMQNTKNLEKLHAKTREMKDLLEKSKSYAYQILPAMEEVRAVADQIEVLLGEEYKPFPSYEDLLYSVQ